MIDVNVSRNVDSKSKEGIIIDFIDFETCPAHGTLTVRNVIDLMSRTKNDWGVPGYEMPKNDFHNLHSHAV